MTAGLQQWTPSDIAVAACTEADPDAFFAGETERQRWAIARARDLARDYCAACPLRTECARIAAEIGAEGLWGGIWHPSPDSGRRPPIDLLDTE